MKLLGLLVGLVLILSFIGIGQTLYHSDNTRDIYGDSDNITAQLRSKLHFNITDLSNVSMEDRNMYRINNLFYTSFNFITGVSIEVIGFGLEYGYNNPQWDAFRIVKTIVNLFIIYVILVSIIPLIVVGYFIYLLYKVIRDWIRKKRIRKSNLKRNGDENNGNN